MLTKERFLHLLDRYIQDTINPEERSQLFDAITSQQFDDLLIGHLDSSMSSTQQGANLAPHRSASILHTILASEKQNATLLPAKPNLFTLVRIAAATAAIVVISLTIYFLAPSRPSTRTNLAFSKGMMEQHNTSSTSTRIKLEDGTVITLQPGSSIHYPPHFAENKREVLLDGEAFFDVTKNATRPFYVYNNNIVTHVLGTSFNVRYNPATKQVEVAVRSGRVEVYENRPTDKKNNGVILLPNQKTIYNQEAGQFISSLVDKPLPLLRETKNESIETAMSFDESPLKNVLDALEKTYGVEILLENEALYQSLFTGDLIQPDLYARLDAVCLSVQASYEVKGTRILIKTKEQSIK